MAGSAPLQWRSYTVAEARRMRHFRFYGATRGREVGLECNNQPTEEDMTSSLHIDTPAACAKHATLFVAFELGKAKWKLGLVTPGGSKFSQYTVAGGDAQAALQLITKVREKAEKKAGSSVRIVSCYEAGYDGFWLHRWLERRGIENRVLDAASIQGNRRARRAKIDRLDLEQLM